MKSKLSRETSLKKIDPEALQKPAPNRETFPEPFLGSFYSFLKVVSRESFDFIDFWYTLHLISKVLPLVLSPSEKVLFSKLPFENKHIVILKTFALATFGLGFRETAMDVRWKRAVVRRTLCFTMRCTFAQPVADILPIFEGRPTRELRFQRSFQTV